MILRDLSLPTPEENILFDDVLFMLAEDGQSGEVLRFWESPEYFVVLGRIGRLKEEVYIEKARQDKILILRRSSGGGTVLQGPGCLNYSLILNKEIRPQLQDLRKSYQYILGRIMAALAKTGRQPMFCPLSDMAIGREERKFSGNAQRRGRKFILHHGTILYNFHLDLMEKYLRFPVEMPRYRRGRPHASFVTNLPVPAHEIKKYLKEEFSAVPTHQGLTAEERLLMNYLCAQKKMLLMEEVSSAIWH